MKNIFLKPKEEKVKQKVQKDFRKEAAKLQKKLDLLAEANKKQDVTAPLDDGQPAMKKMSTWLALKGLLIKSPYYLINMQMRNGMHRSFVISTRKSSFSFQRGTYIIDTEARYYSIDNKRFALDYHQDIATPLHRNVDVNEIKKALQNDEEYEVENAINPFILQEFMISKVAEGVMRGQAIDEYLRRMKMMILITMIASILSLLLGLVGGGMLNGLNLPGL